MLQNRFLISVMLWFFHVSLMSELQKVNTIAYPNLCQILDQVESTFHKAINKSQEHTEYGVRDLTYVFD